MVVDEVESVSVYFEFVCDFSFLPSQITLFLRIYSSQVKTVLLRTVFMNSRSLCCTYSPIIVSGLPSYMKCLERKAKRSEDLSLFPRTWQRTVPSGKKRKQRQQQMTWMGVTGYLSLFSPIRTIFSRQTQQPLKWSRGQCLKSDSQLPKDLKYCPSVFSSPISILQMKLRKFSTTALRVFGPYQFKCSWTQVLMGRKRHSAGRDTGPGLNNFTQRDLQQSPIDSDLKTLCCMLPVSEKATSEQGSRQCITFKMQSPGTCSKKSNQATCFFSSYALSSTFSPAVSISASTPYCFSNLRQRSAMSSSESSGFLMMDSMREVGFLRSLATQATRLVLRQSNSQNSWRMRMVSRLRLRQALLRAFTSRVIGSTCSFFISNSFINHQKMGGRRLPFIQKQTRQQCLLNLSLMISRLQIQKTFVVMRQGLVLFLLVAICSAQSCGQILENCKECDYSSDPPTACLTCAGWYEASWQTQLCVLSARLIILCVVSGLLVTGITICSVVKIKEYRAKYTERPTNIESLEDREIQREKLDALQWKTSNEKINDVSKCNICQSNGGSVRLNCGHVFHGDCICWHLRSNDDCPASGCGDRRTDTCRVYCMKCLTSYLECPPSLYVDIKKGRSRVCDSCLRKE